MNLHTRLQSPDIVTAPGVYDPLSALLVEQAGFEAAYLSGASIAYTRFGRPDIGFLSLDDVASVTGHIRERVGLHLIVDADTGFGNALNVRRTVQVLERAGASAIQFEDQTLPKRCG
ncbi:MAG: carboxyvinyl-carboxyphosphonate phosphorylmutase, partial [Variovorax sp.]|nr:carboxyvinyl-carboxyphosphonate phosphorylmutase [Variovorax sp.]